MGRCGAKEREKNKPKNLLKVEKQKTPKWIWTRIRVMLVSSTDYEKVNFWYRSAERMAECEREKNETSRQGG